MNKVFITGATGFVGKSIVTRFKNINELVVIPLKRDLQFQNSRQQDEAEPILINCAWAGVLGADRDSKVQIENIKYTKRLAKFIIKNNIKNVIAFGSQAEYGNIDKITKEDSPLNPITLYGKIKIECHKLLLELLEPHGITVTWLRLYDPYGPGDNPKWFLPYVINCALTETSPRLTECTQLWDYIYIDDLIDLTLSIVKNKPLKSNVYNASSAKPISLMSVTKKVFEIAKPKIARPKFGAISFREGQQFYVCGSNDKANKDFNWSPVTSIEEGIKSTISVMRQILLSRT